MAKQLKHVGVLGMKWGRRMSRDGSVTTMRKGKRVPLTTQEAKTKVKSWLDKKGFTKEPFSGFLQNAQSAGKVMMVAAAAYAATKAAIRLSEYLIDGS